MSEWIKTTLWDKQYFKIQWSWIAFFEWEKNYISTSSVDLDNILFIEDIVRYYKRPSRANMQPLKNSVWFAKMKNTLKVINPTDDIINNFIFSTGFCGIYSENVNNFYLTHFLLSEQFNHEKDLKAEWSTQEAVNNSSTSTISISFPESIKEQEKIAEILTKIDESIKKTEKIILKQERIKKWLMQDLLTKWIDENWVIRNEKTHKFKDSELWRIPEEWDCKSLLQTFHNKKHLIIAWPFGSNLKTDDYQDIWVPLIRLQNIDRNNFIMKDIKYVSESKYNELKYHSFISWDIVISKLWEPIWKTCFIPNELKYWIVVADVVRVRNEDFINTDLLSYILNSYYVYEQWNNEIIGSTRQRVNLSQIRNVLIKFPWSIKEQEKIAEIFKNQDEIIQKEKNQLEKLQRLKKWLMQDLLNWKVKVTNLITN